MLENKFGKKYLAFSTFSSKLVQSLHLKKAFIPKRRKLKLGFKHIEILITF